MKTIMSFLLQAPAGGYGPSEFKLDSSFIFFIYFAAFLLVWGGYEYSVHKKNHPGEKLYLYTLFTKSASLSRLFVVLSATSLIIFILLVFDLFRFDGFDNDFRMTIISPILAIVFGILAAVIRPKQEHNQSVKSENTAAGDHITNSQSKVERMKELHTMLDEGLISNDDYEAQKRKILDS